MNGSGITTMDSYRLKNFTKTERKKVKELVDNALKEISELGEAELAGKTEGKPKGTKSAVVEEPPEAVPAGHAVDMNDQPTLGDSAQGVYDVELNALAMPRELSASDDGSHVQIRPIPEMSLLRRKHVRVGSSRALQPGTMTTFSGVGGWQLEVRANFVRTATQSDAALQEFGVHVATAEAAGETVRVGIALDAEGGGHLRVDRRRASVTPPRCLLNATRPICAASVLEAPLPSVDATRFEMVLYLDHSILEVFLN